MEREDGGHKGLEVEVFSCDLFFNLEGVTTFSVNDPMGHLKGHLWPAALPSPRAQDSPCCNGNPPNFLTAWSRGLQPKAAGGVLK